jgi:hypothetical protein
MRDVSSGVAKAALPPFDAAEWSQVGPDVVDVPQETASVIQTSILARPTSETHFRNPINY